MVHDDPRLPWPDIRCRSWRTGISASRRIGCPATRVLSLSAFSASPPLVRPSPTMPVAGSCWRPSTAPPCLPSPQQAADVRPAVGAAESILPSSRAGSRNRAAGAKRLTTSSAWGPASARPWTRPVPGSSNGLQAAAGSPVRRTAWYPAMSPCFSSNRALPPPPVRPRRGRCRPPEPPERAKAGFRAAPRLRGGSSRTRRKALTTDHRKGRAYTARSPRPPPGLRPRPACAPRQRASAPGARHRDRPSHRAGRRRDHPVQAIGCGICGPGGAIGGTSVGCPGAGVSAGGDEGVGTDGGRPGNSGPGPGGGAMGGVSAGSGPIGGKPGNSGGGCCAGSESTRGREAPSPTATCVLVMRVGTRGGALRLPSPAAEPAIRARCRGFRRGMRGACLWHREPVAAARPVGGAAGQAVDHHDAGAGLLDVAAEPAGEPARRDLGRLGGAPELGGAAPPGFGSAPAAN